MLVREGDYKPDKKNVDSDQQQGRKGDMSTVGDGTVGAHILDLDGQGGPYGEGAF